MVVRIIVRREKVLRVRVVRPVACEVGLRFVLKRIERNRRRRINDVALDATADEQQRSEHEESRHQHLAPRRHFGLD